jgi:hypothetical protein
MLTGAAVGRLACRRTADPPGERHEHAAGDGGARPRAPLELVAPEPVEHGVTDGDHGRVARLAGDQGQLTHDLVGAELVVRHLAVLVLQEEAEPSPGDDVQAVPLVSLAEQRGPAGSTTRSSSSSSDDPSGSGASGTEVPGDPAGRADPCRMISAARCSSARRTSSWGRDFAGSSPTLGDRSRVVGRGGRGRRPSGSLPGQLRRPCLRSAATAVPAGACGGPTGGGGPGSEDQERQVHQPEHPQRAPRIVQNVNTVSRTLARPATSVSTSPSTGSHERISSGEPQRSNAVCMRSRRAVRWGCGLATTPRRETRGSSSRATPRSRPGCRRPRSRARSSPASPSPGRGPPSGTAARWRRAAQPGRARTGRGRRPAARPTIIYPQPRSPRSDRRPRPTA